MTKEQAEKAFKTGQRVDLRCYHGTFLNRQISRIYSTKDKYGKVYDLADITCKRDKNGVITAGVEDLEIAESNGDFL